MSCSTPVHLGGKSAPAIQMPSPITIRLTWPAGTLSRAILKAAGLSTRSGSKWSFALWNGSYGSLIKLRLNRYADTNDYGGDSDVFNGDYTQLQKLATG